MGIWEQLGLDMARHRMVALVGAGGKTSTLYALARQAADMVTVSNDEGGVARGVEALMDRIGNS